MSDTVLENIVTRKLIISAFGALGLVITCFFLGGFLAPLPSNIEVALGIKCRTSGDHNEWHIPRGISGEPVNCNSDINSTTDVVFAFQLPLPRDKNQRTFSRWMQKLAGIIYFYIAKPVNGSYSFLYTFEVRLGSKEMEDHTNNWTTIGSSIERQNVNCHPYNNQELNKAFWECNFIPLFEIESVHHDYYLLNLYPLAYNSSNWQLNQLQEEIVDISLMTVTQNERYTKMFLSLKTTFFFILLFVIIWFWRRIVQLTRPSLMYERLIMLLGIVLTFLNFPLEFLTLWIEVPFMNLISALLLDAFFMTLLGFWLIFFAEHLGRSERNRLSLYWQQILAVIIGCLPVFGYGLYNQSMPLMSVFYADSEVRRALNIGFFTLSGLLSFAYLVVLSVLIISVYRKIDFKISCLPNMLGALTLGYGRTMLRVKFLLIASLLCACLIFASFLAGQVIQNWWKFGWNVAYLHLGALTLGVYALKNIYVMIILILYAPSQRFPEQSFLCHENTSYVISEHYEDETVK